MPGLRAWTSDGPQGGLVDSMETRALEGMEPFLSRKPSGSWLDLPAPAFLAAAHGCRVSASPDLDGRVAPQANCGFSTVLRCGQHHSGFEGKSPGLPRSSGSDDAARGPPVHRACHPRHVRFAAGGADAMSVVADYPFLNIMWSMFIFFAWVIFIYLLILVLADNFRRTDHSGWAKAGWTLFVIFVPLIGVLVYMIARPSVDMSVV
jgi:hypothetical protein